MTTIPCDLPVPPDDLWAVLADPASYPDWVVGARRIRAADEGWPAPGSTLHHELSVGIEDSTTVMESEAGRRLVLRARARPAGVAKVVITITPTDAGSKVEMEEEAIEGPASLIPEAILRPLIEGRNTESLRRLGELAQARQS